MPFNDFSVVKHAIINQTKITTELNTMGEFDRVIKENIELIFVPILEKLLNFTIAESFEIKDKIQRTLERKPDYLKRVIDGQWQEFILQLEFQTNDDHEMVYRTAEYRAILQRKHRLPVRQFVIYLGDDMPKMRTILDPEEQITGFELYNIRTLSTDKSHEEWEPAQTRDRTIANPVSFA